MRKALIALVLGLLLSAHAQAETSLTLEDAFRIGLASNHGIRIARENEARAADERAYGRAGWLPRLSLDANWRRIDGDDTGNGTTSFGETETSLWDAGLNLDWTLFDGFAMFVEQARYDDLAALGSARAMASIENELLAIARAYFGLVGQRQLRDVADETLAISASRLDQERIRRELGGLSSAEFLRARVDYNTDKAALLERELLVSTGTRSLNLLLGRDPDTNCPVSETIPLEAMAHDHSALFARADSLSSGLAAARIERDLAGRDLGSAKAAFWPSLALNAGYELGGRDLSGAGIDPVVETESKDLSVGLRLSLDLFDGNRKRTRLNSANAAARIAAIEEEQAKLTLRTDLAALVDTWEQRLTIVELEEENVEAARKSLELGEERYRSGASTSLEFRDAQLALGRARSALILARYRARLTKLEIERLAGMLPLGGP